MNKRLFQKTNVCMLTTEIDCFGKSRCLYTSKLGEFATTFNSVKRHDAGGGVPVGIHQIEGVNYITMDESPFGRRTGPTSLLKDTHIDVVSFMVDSSDTRQLLEMKQELDLFSGEEELKDAMFLIFAKGQEVPNAMSVEEITQKLDLKKIRDRSWYIQDANCGLDLVWSQLAAKKSKSAVLASASKTIADCKKDFKSGKTALCDFCNAIQTRFQKLRLY